MTKTSASTPVASFFSRTFAEDGISGEEQYTVDSLRLYAEQLIAEQLIADNKNENKNNSNNRESRKICVYLAGGGSTAVAMLAATPGASSYLLEGRTTYDRHSFLNACGILDRATEGKSFSYSGAKAAGLAAGAALQQALALEASDDDLRTMPTTVGIGGTVVAVSADGRILTLGIEMKRPRSRFDEELVLGHLVLRAAELLATMTTTPNHQEYEYETSAGDWVTESWSRSPDLSSLSMDGAPTASADTDGTTDTTGFGTSTESVVEEAARRVTVLPNGCLVFPGSFNPPHIGHLSLAKASIRTLERLEPYVHPRKHNEKPILFELSLTNADKPSIDPTVVAERVRKFLDLAAADADADADVFPQQWGIVLTRAPLFEEKLRILRRAVATTTATEDPRVNFVIGTDTLVRILNPKYYPDQSPDRMAESLLELNRSGAGFIVGGRLEQGTTTASQDGREHEEPRFVSGREELEGLPDAVAAMFAVMDESEFRIDLSSSELRAKQAREREQNQGQ
eukprot:jgi/Psemu1/288317/fgenesh1_pg.253_\